MSELFNTKSLLAKLMATENLAIEQRKVPTAYFDLKSRVLCLPILKSDLSTHNYDHFIGHEVGHALYTPSEEYSEASKKTKKSVLNVVEDVRIERKIKYKYPGLKNSFIKSYTDLIERDFFGTKDQDLNQLNFIDRANLYFKGGPAQGIEFTDEEMEYIKLMDSTETFPDVVEVTHKLCGFMEEQARDKIKIGKGFEPEETDESDVDQDSTNNPDMEMSQEEQEDKSGTRQDSETMAEENDQNIDQMINDMIESKTDQAFKDNEQQLFDPSAREIVYANLPDIDLQRIVIPHKELYASLKESQRYKNLLEQQTTFMRENETNFIKYQKELSRMVSYLVKEFELRKNADQMKRAQVAKTGDLHLGKAYAYKFSEDIFKKLTVIPDGKSHGLVMFLDWSGSMRNSIDNTSKQMLALIMFCKKVNIPYEVYAFGEGTARDSMISSVAVKKGDIALGNFTLYNIFSSKMTASEFKFAATCFCSTNPYTVLCAVMGMSGTPLNEAIISAMKIVPQFQKKNNLQIVNTIILTDGESNNLHNYYDNGTKEIGGKNLVLRDPMSKIEAKVDRSNYRSNFGVQMTQALVDILKRKTNGNVVGFYILKPGGLSRALRFYGKYIDNPLENMNYEEKMKTEFRDNKFVILEPRGFDEYYLLKDDRIDTDGLEFEDVQIKSNTSRSIVSSFKKFNKNRLESRVVLNRFIKLIA